MPVHVLRITYHREGRDKTLFPVLIEEAGEKLLVAADALVVENGVLELANPQFALDLPQALASVKKIRKLTIRKLICYHGGVFDQDIKVHLDRLLDSYTHRAVAE